MPTFTTPGMIAEMRRFSEGALDQTYTRVPIVGLATQDEWGQQEAESGPPVSGLACKLRTLETVQRDDRGAMLLRRPMLSIGLDDVLAVGDLVTDVRDGDGRLLLASAAVLRIDVSAVGVGTVGLVAELDGAEAVPLPAPGVG
jgi:hypothetical protein